MNKLLLGVFWVSVGLTIYSCTPIRGCTEETADNFSINAEEDDGTCIPSRDKLIGNFTYTALWTDVVTANDTIVLGTIQVTEANTAHNAFNMNFDGSLFLQGSVAQNNIVFEYHTFGTSTYTGTGTWLANDSVDAVLAITYTNSLLPVPQPIAYYCTKVN
ncbi:MAG: hypothetical protein H6601_06135 [Flavobacteriales bacterium]|nr:hypothetical protein [Flavobacteriales bacterium]